MIFNLKIKDISFQLGSKKQSFKDYKLENPDWNEEKIKQKTGIEKQFILSEKETPLSLAEKACHKLSYNYKDIDLLIYITQAPDYFLPSGSCILQDKLKLKKSVFSCVIPSNFLRLNKSKKSWKVLMLSTLDKMFFTSRLSKR